MKNYIKGPKEKENACNAKGNGFLKIHIHVPEHGVGHKSTH